MMVVVSDVVVVVAVAVVVAVNVIVMVAIIAFVNHRYRDHCNPPHAQEKENTT